MGFLHCEQRYFLTGVAPVIFNLIWIAGIFLWLNKDLKIELFGQERNPITYAICKSDFLMADENPDNIKGPRSSLSEDGYPDRKFDYMITNPPFGVSWKADEDFVKNEAKDNNGRFSIGTPRTSDGSLLFLQHLIHKMEPKGSRIGIVFNGSPLLTGNFPSGAIAKVLV